MTHYKAIFKNKYEYEFRISPEDNTRYQYLNWQGVWTDIGAIEEYKKTPGWVIVAIHQI